MLLHRRTHSIWRIHFNFSVTPSVIFICSMMVSNRSCACSFRSARYVHNSPVSINVFNLAGWTFLKYSRCIRPFWCAFPLCSCWQSYSLSYRRQALNPLFSYHALTVCARVVYSWCAYCFPAFLSIPPGGYPGRNFSLIITPILWNHNLFLWSAADTVWIVLFLSFCSRISNTP